ncbi:MAG TPA: hypothetical protein VJV78_10470 [Polyangiales bacterium]|nr:hypothetical protein [Polyangiales bacterium]
MKLWMCACLAIGLISSVSCEDVDETLDCNSICHRYADCFDKSYDTDKCADRCETRAEDPDSHDQEERCSDCIDGASCGGAAFSCAPDCLGIVP